MEILIDSRCEFKHRLCVCLSSNFRVSISSVVSLYATRWQRVGNLCVGIQNFLQGTILAIGVLECPRRGRVSQISVNNYIAVLLTGYAGIDDRIELVLLRVAQTFVGMDDHGVAVGTTHVLKSAVNHADTSDSSDHSKFLVGFRLRGSK